MAVKEFVIRRLLPQRWGNLEYFLDTVYNFLFNSRMSTFFADPTTRPPLDENAFSLSPEALAFFKSHTGISDEDALKEHIITVQKKAYEVSYPILYQNVFLNYPVQ